MAVNNNESSNVNYGSHNSFVIHDARTIITTIPETTPNTNNQVSSDKNSPNKSSQKKRKNSDMDVKNGKEQERMRKQAIDLPSTLRLRCKHHLTNANVNTFNQHHLLSRKCKHINEEKGYNCSEATFFCNTCNEAAQSMDRDVWLCIRCVSSPEDIANSKVTKCMDRHILAHKESHHQRKGLRIKQEGSEGPGDNTINEDVLNIFIQSIRQQWNYADKLRNDLMEAVTNPFIYKEEKEVKDGLTTTKIILTPLRIDKPDQNQASPQSVEYTPPSVPPNVQSQSNQHHPAAVPISNTYQQRTPPQRYQSGNDKPDQNQASHSITETSSQSVEYTLPSAQSVPPNVQPQSKQHYPTTVHISNTLQQRPPPQLYQSRDNHNSTNSLFDRYLLVHENLDYYDCFSSLENTPLQGTPVDEILATLENGIC
jgi:hypothetical protein